MQPFVQNTQIKWPFTTVDDAGALFDASTISVVIMAPDGSKTTLTLAGGGVTRTALGTYYFIVTASQPTIGGTGEYVIAATATIGGFVKVELERFAVVPDPTL